MALIRSVVILLLASCPSQIFGQVVQSGDCPNLSTQPSFNPARFITGAWYEIYRYPSVFQPQSTCSLIEIKPSNLGFMRISFKGISTKDKSVTNATGRAFYDRGQLSKIIIDMPAPAWNTTLQVHFWVMDTDYTNYAVVWSCDPLDCPTYRREQLWVLSRTGTLSDDIWNAINQKFFASGIFRSDYLTKIDQTNCPKLTVLKNANSEEDLFFLAKLAK